MFMFVNGNWGRLCTAFGMGEINMIELKMLGLIEDSGFEQDNRVYSGGGYALPYEQTMRGLMC